MTPRKTRCPTQKVNTDELPLALSSLVSESALMKAIEWRAFRAPLLSNKPEDYLQKGSYRPLSKPHARLTIHLKYGIMMCKKGIMFQKVRRNPGTRGKYSLSTAEKTLDILESLASQKNGVGLAELSREIGMPKSTLFRYLATLERRGYVSKDGLTGRYELGFKLFQLGSMAVARHSVREMALPFMHSLLDQFSETVNLGIMESGEVLYLEILESPQAMRMSSRVGNREHAHATSLGKAMLAFMSEAEVEEIVRAPGLPPRTEKTITTLEGLKEELGRVRERGYAIDDEENEPMARCVGVPIFNRFGEVAGALSLAGPAHRFSEAKVESMGQALMEAASRISERMQYYSG